MYRYAIIGCGDTGQMHASAIVRSGALAAVCDIMPSRAQALAATFDSASFSSIDDMLRSSSEFDVAVVCTPSGCHAEHIIKSLQAGLHVISESPLCLTKAGAWQIIETEKYCNKKLLVRTGTGDKAARIKELIDPVDAGKISFEMDLPVLTKRAGDWRSARFPGGGPLYDAAAIFSVLSYLFGPLERAEGSIGGISSSDDAEVEAEGEARVVMAKGKGVVRWSREMTAAELRVRLNGTEERLLSEDIDVDRFHELYSQLPEGFASLPGGCITVHQAAETVEAIEKIYGSILKPMLAR